MSRFTAILILALVGALGIARADTVYRWVDSHGEVHYTDQWRPGAKLIMTNVPHSQSPGLDSKSWAGIDSEDQAASKSIEKQQAERAVAQDEAKNRAKECKAAQARYNQLIQARRLYTTDASGERHYLSDAQADAQRVQARETMDSVCNPQSGS
jgi:hypothetical protein